MCCGYEGAFRQEVCPSEQASRSLVDGKDGFIGEQLFFNTGDFGNSGDIIPITVIDLLAIGIMSPDYSGIAF